MESINSLPLMDSQSMLITSFNARQTISKGRKIKLRSNPIFRMNYFIKCYNTSYNKVNEIALVPLPRSKIYSTVYPMLQAKYFIIHLSLAFLPYINLLWAVVIIFLWLVYERAALVYRKNRNRLRNPFANMIYEPNLCKYYNCMNKFLEFPIESVSYTTTELQPSREKVTVMIYNNNFKKMCTHFPYYRFLHLTHVALCISVGVLCYIWLYNILKFDKLIPIFGRSNN